MIRHLLFHILKKEKFFLVLITVFSIILLLSFTLNFYQDARVVDYYHGFEEISSHDYYVFKLLSLQGIERQFHFFFFFFYLVFFFLFMLFFNICSYKMHEEDILIMKLRGFSFIKSQGLFWIVRSVYVCIISFMSIAFYALSLMLLNAILDTEITLVTFDQRVYFVALFESLFFTLLSLPFYIQPFSKKKLIALIRNK